MKISKCVMFVVLLLILLPFTISKEISHVVSKEEIEVTADKIRTFDSSEHYIYGVSGKEAVVKDSEVTYFHSDHLGSNSLVTNSEGELVEESKYLPFGEALQESEERFTFTGKELDEKSKLQYTGARYYDQDMGRFTTVDPIKDGLNHYVYANNNPLKYIDPSGLNNYAVIVGFTGMRSELQMNTKDIISGMGERLGFSDEDVLDIYVFHSRKLDTTYMTEEMVEEDYSISDTIRGNIGGTEYGGLTDWGYIHEWELIAGLGGETPDVNLIFENFYYESSPENIKYLYSLLERYDEVVTFGHGGTMGEDFLFLDGLMGTSFEEYMGYDNWLDISCGSTCPGDSFSVANDEINIRDLDSLVRKMGSIRAMAFIGPSLKENFDLSQLQPYENPITSGLIFQTEGFDHPVFSSWRD